MKTVVFLMATIDLLHKSLNFICRFWVLIHRFMRAKRIFSPVDGRNVSKSENMLYVV
jgi:hypothetical protein